MHTYVGRGFNVHHSSDLSGNVEIVSHKTNEMVSLPGHLLLEFIANWVRERKVSEAENMTDSQALGVDLSMAYPVDAR